MRASQLHPLRLLVRQARQRLETASPIESEESVLLRVLAQAMVLLGIIATDIAAETQISLWAIPFSIAGAAWSWRRRHQRNITAKFCIAIGMLLALAAFFVNLTQQLNDTRLVLAELLVQLQVLHSFDLPRRKDLGYSMVIGLILIGVACTLSQTMMFGLVLLLFLAIALPVLVLDYRSRLGLLGRSLKTPWQRTGLSPRQLGAFFLMILALGLTIFAVMPRLPGYQLRTFPVSGQLSSPQRFDTSRITNPGYVRLGDATKQGRGGSGQGTGLSPGQMDENFYYGFNRVMNQNLRGQLKPKVVLRIRSQAEGFWRVLAFDRYLGQGWEISRNDQAQKIERPAWSYQFYLPRPVWLNRTQEVVQTFTVVSELPNLIPALMQPKDLYFPTQEIALDPDGNLRSPLELLEGLTYTAISEVPYRDRTRLRSAPTRYPRSIRAVHLTVPPQIRARVRQQTEALLATSPNPLSDPYEKALFLAQALKQRYSIQPDLPFLAQDEDLVEAFLFKYQGGYPDHFSTALTIMLRSIGIPARLTVGFGPGEFNPFTGLYVVRNTDAYAITEVYFPRYGWFAFDPIPGHDLIPPSIEDNQTFSTLQQFWKWIAGWLPSPVSSALNGFFGWLVEWLMGSFAWLMNLASRGWVGAFILLLLAICLAFLSWLLWQGWRRWRYQRRLAKLPPMERLYQKMLDQLAARGFGKQAAQTPLEYARQSWQTQPELRASAIAEISQAYVQWRYGGEPPDLERLQRRYREVLTRRPPRRDRSRDRG